MATEVDDEIDRQESELKFAHDFLQPRVDRLQKSYAQAINRLWLGNAGAALATLSFIGASGTQNSSVRAAMLVPLACFACGLLTLGIGELIGLIRDAKAVGRNQYAQSVGDMYIDDAESPLEKSGASLNRKTLLQASAAIFFAVGLISGFLLLFYVLTR